MSSTAHDPATTAPVKFAANPFTIAALETASQPATGTADAVPMMLGAMQTFAVAAVLTVSGSDGDDALAGDNTPGNVIDGGGGADHIIGTGDSDWTRDDSDNISGGDGYDTIYGCNGNDTIDGGAGFDRIFGGQGNDRVTDLIGGSYVEGGKGNDWLKGGDWYTTLIGGDGADTLIGGSWGAVLKGGWGADSITGGIGNDSMYGEGDVDYLFGGAGHDSIYGGIGNDVVSGGTGNDVLVGDEGADTLQGGEGDDQLYDGLGNDMLDGGSGNDRLVAMEGNDTMTGGTGADIFDFRRSSYERTGIDRVNDFKQGEDRMFIGYGEDAARIIATAKVYATSVVLQFGEGATFTLHGVTTPLLESDFIYG